MQPLRTCRRCNVEKLVVEFHRRGISGYQQWCKSCRASYDVDYHIKMRERRRKQKRLLHEKHAAWYRALKEGKPCADCGRTYHYAAMTWDHRPGTTKIDDVANLYRKRNRNKVVAEIAKCDLVCANCHAVRTYRRQRGVAQPG